MPIAEVSLRARRALATRRGVVGAPSSAASSGAAKMSKVSEADTGYPGAPITGVDPIAPSTTGCPGRTATPWTARMPRRSTSAAV